MAALAVKRARGVQIGTPAEEGFLSRAMRRTVQTGMRPRAVDMALKKWRAEPYTSELAVETFEAVPPPPPLHSCRGAVCPGDGGRTGAARKSRPASGSRNPLGALMRSGMERLVPGEWEAVHGG